MDLRRLVSNRKLMLPLLLLLIIVIGLLAGWLLPGYSGCTLMGCPCQGVEGERPCNACFSSNPIFFTGLININKYCRSPEIITCRNDTQVDRRVDYSQKECQWQLKYFGINFNSLFNKPEQQTESRFNAPS